MRTIVLSGVNLVSGGTLKILQDCAATVRHKLPDWRVVAIVNNPGIITVPGVETISMPEVKKSWFKRIYAEYFGFRKLSRDLKPDIWFSMHDISPVVTAGSQFVYCHHPDCFYSFSAKEIYNEPKLLIFSAVYSLFYRINIRANCGVVVQQQWVRREFEKRYGVRNVLVAHPVEDMPLPPVDRRAPINTFVYPSLPRGFKNFELLGEAALLLDREPDWNGQILWTIGPDESRLTRHLHKAYGGTRSIRFIGLQDRAAMNRLYEEMDCLLFPSRLETWGLPISETKSLGKPMIVADLPYAHETVGSYDQVRFVDPADPRALADSILDVHRHGWSSTSVCADPIPQPFADNWPELVDRIVALHEERRS